MLVLIVACFTFQVMDKLCAVEAPSSLIEKYLMAIADCYNYKFEPDAKLKVSIDTLLISHTNNCIFSNITTVINFLFYNNTFQCNNTLPCVKLVLNCIKRIISWCL